ncbi:MAG: hypothetical protein GOU98_01660 [Candidatus Altiarchaeota archaeon]|nr:hypothetical protein [Candidatus Altiarchaeota archaeon]
MSLALTMMFLGIVMFVGYIASELFETTKIPDSLILIAVGMGLNYSGLVDSAALEPLTELIASIAIVMLLFESGLSIDFRGLTSSFSHAFNMANISFIFSSLGIAGLTYFFVGWDPLTSLMVGFMLGGTSSSIVTPLAKKMMSHDMALVAELESTITSVYNFVFTFTVASILQNAQVSANFVLSNLLSYFSIGVFLGIAFGIGWINFSKKIWQKQISYMMTLATLFILYGFAEYGGGSGAVAGLVFGLILGNNKEISEIIKTPAIGTGRFRKFSHEMAFLIRTYFFIFLGIILRIPSNRLLWIFAVLLALTTFSIRLTAARLLGLPQEMALLIPRGLSEAVIASIIVGMGLLHSEEIINLVGLIIIVTNIVPSVIMIRRKWGGKGYHKGEDPKEEDTDKAKASA